CRPSSPDGRATPQPHPYLFVTGPGSGGVLVARSAGTVDRRLDGAEHRTLQRTREHDLPRGVPAIGGLRRGVLAADAFPHLAEQRRRQHSARGADGDTQRLVQHLHRLALHTITPPHTSTATMATTTGPRVSTEDDRRRSIRPLACAADASATDR